MSKKKAITADVSGHLAIIRLGSGIYLVEIVAMANRNLML